MHCPLLILHHYAQQHKCSLPVDSNFVGGVRSVGVVVVESGKLVINEEEKPIVEYVFNARAKGVAMQTIADGLRDLGYKTRKGTYFQAQSIASILANEPLYRGMYKYGKEMNWVKGVHEPILTEEGSAEQ